MSASVTDFVKLWMNKEYEKAESIIPQLRNRNFLYNGLPLLVYFIETNDIKGVETLLKNGADPNIRLKNNMTTLLLACLHNNKEIVELLIEYGVNTTVYVNHEPKDITTLIDNEELKKIINKHIETV